MLDLTIERTWDGVAIPAVERSRVRAAIEHTVDWPARARLRVVVEAPLHGDPPPPYPPGRTPGLWGHEVVELFLVGADGRALEIELGPAGHWLALLLDGPRLVARDDLPLACRVAPAGDGSDPGEARWRGEASLDASLVPGPIERANAFAIHGVGPARRYLAAHPLGGPRPDFHRFADYPRLD